MGKVNDKFRPYRKNPLLVFVYDYLPNILPKPIKLFSPFLFGIILFIPVFIIAWYYDALIVPGPVYGLIEQGTHILISLILIPMGLIILKFIYSTYEETLDKIEKLMDISKKESIKFKKERIELFDHKIQFIFMIIFLSVLWPNSFYNTYRYLAGTYEIMDIWASDYVLTAIISLWTTFVMIIVMTMCWHLFAIIIIIWKICDKKLELRPLDPDGAGGLRPLSNLTFTMSSICLLALPIILYAIFISGEDIFYQSYLKTIIVGFVGMMIIVFFLPLVKAHNAMKTTKEEILALLTEEHYEIYKTIRDRIEDPGPTIDAETLQDLNGISDLYDKANNMPIWPFDTSILTKFFAAVILPLLLIFGGQFIQTTPISLEEPNEPPIADAGPDLLINVSETTIFYGSGVDHDGDIVLIEWDFNGDGIYEWKRDETLEWDPRADNYVATHTYNKTGNYLAVFRVTDNDDASTRDTCFVEVS